ncbi:MAG: TonB-dependent receptor plug domain-containing protein [Akkermansiaceae bacterium]|nr:TonB-dependent receptor plug domain-containing protein [Akkermansiaceae bacterium]
MKAKRGVYWIMMVVFMTGVGMSFGKGRSSLSESSTAIDVISNDHFGRAGGTNLADLVNSIPDSGRTLAGYARSAEPGLLRGVGPSRTLVLVEGRVASHGDYAALRADRTEVVSGGLGILFSRETPGFSMAFTAGAAMTRYDDAELPRDGDDQNIFDFDGAFTARRTFSDRLELTSLARYHYGGHGTIGSGYLRDGVLFSNNVDIHSHHLLSYRFDDAALGDRGLEFGTSVEYGQFSESGRDDIDSYRLRFTQEVRSNLNDSTTIFGEAAFGLREWDQWSPVDSDHYRLGAGVRGQSGEIDFAFKGGLHHREYDDLNTDRDELYVVFSAGGSLSERLDFSVIGDYAVQDIFVDFAGERFVDPIGFRGGTRFKYKASDRIGVNFGVNYMELKSDFSPGTFPSETITRLAATVSGDVQIQDNLVVTPGVQFVDYDYAGFDTSYWIFGVGLRGTY